METPLVTHEEIRRAVTRGTTTRPDAVRVLAANATHALVRWPGGYEGRHAFRSWVPCWIELVAFAQFGDSMRGWVKDVAKPKRLTRKSILALAAAYNMEAASS